MTVELEKNMMTGMLTVLGKLVNRNAADKSYLVLRLEAKDGVLPVKVSGILETNVLDLDYPASAFHNRDGHTFAWNPDSAIWA